jgi:hypothetical protein
MGSAKTGGAGRRLIWLSVIAAVLATLAAANLTLIYLLFVLGQPGSNLAGFVPIMAIGAVPFLVTAGLLAWAIVSAGSSVSPGQLPPKQVIGRLRIITGFGLPVMIVGGLWSGLGAAFLGLDQGSAAGFALTLYQFTFLAAVFLDTVTLVVALRTRAAPHLPLN